jgi:hypothetical protein
MTTEEIVEPELTADEANYAAASARLTLLGCAIAEKREAMALYAFQHPLRTASVCEELIRMRGELEVLEHQLQELLRSGLT